MNKRIYLPIILIGLGLMIIPLGLAQSASNADLGTGFTYQGRLHDGGTPASGTYNMVFRLYDDQSKTTLLGTVNIIGVTVSDGLFTVDLDFGVNVFNGQARWLEIEVNGTPLSPMQEISPAPYAFALPGLWTQQNGSIPNIIGGYHGNYIYPGVIAGTISGGGYSGSNTTLINQIYDNYGTISGGGRNQSGSDDANTGNARYATVGGGEGNTATAPHSTVAGGSFNDATADSATVGGGASNNAADTFTTVAGGDGNFADSTFATIGGGDNNLAGGDYAFIGGGQDNDNYGKWSTIGGGLENYAIASFATIAGGGPSNVNDPNNTNNQVYDDYGTIGGGGGNVVGIQNSGKFSDYSTIGGGKDNLADGNRSVVSGGSGNKSTEQFTTVGGGISNQASGYAATVGGGDKNIASGPHSTIGGGGDTDGELSGYANYATDAFTTVSGGGNNQAGNKNSSTGDARSATVGGGEDNRALTKFSTIPGGSEAQALSYGQFTYASGKFNNDDTIMGDAQTSIYVLRNETSDGTQTELFLDGGNNSERINITDGQTVAYEFQIAARSDGNQSAGYQGSGVIENYAGTVSSLGYAVTMEIEDDALWSILIAADDTNDALVIKVTGKAATDIRWVATVRTTEVTFPTPP